MHIREQPWLATQGSSCQMAVPLSTNTMHPEHTCGRPMLLTLQHAESPVGGPEGVEINQVGWPLARPD